MIDCTKAFALYKSQSEAMFNFVVVVCYAVPNFSNQLNDIRTDSNNKLLPPDYFKNDTNSPDGLLQKSANYQNVLAAYVVLSGFSYFEAYISEVITEMINFHGGVDKFKRQALSSMTNVNPNILYHKRKLQEPIKPAKIQKYKKHTKVLVDAGYQFPSDLISSYGFHMLQEKVERMKAFEIPNLLKESLQMPLCKATVDRFDKIREMRNSVAHGNPVTISLRDAMQASKDLHALAAKIDNHLVEHFFVINEYVIT
jgi:hypothetical protein